MALGLLTAKEGGGCMVINESCCTYVNQEGRIEEDLHYIWEKTEILHKSMTQAQVLQIYGKF